MKPIPLCCSRGRLGLRNILAQEAAPDPNVRSDAVRRFRNSSCSVIGNLSPPHNLRFSGGIAPGPPEC